MSLEKKRQFIDVTYRIIEEEGPEAVKIRRLAKEMNCTSTVVYRYFDNLDHLISLASMEYFNKYLEDFSNISSDPQMDTDPYGLNLRMWECLASHAFLHIPIYEKLFFGQYKDSLGDVIFEYYQLFLQNSKADFDGYAVNVLFQSDIYERNFILLRRAANMGILSLENAQALCDIECHIFHGILLKYMNDYKKPGIAEKATDEFLNLIKGLASHYRQKA